MTPIDIVIANPQHPSFMQVTLKGLKTDQTHQGIKLFVGWTHKDFCPVATMLSYLLVRSFDHGLLFLTE